MSGFLAFIDNKGNGHLKPVVQIKREHFDCGDCGKTPCRRSNVELHNCMQFIVCTKCGQDCVE